MSKRIIVTGGAGFIGYNLCKKLSEDKSNTIISLDNYSTGKISNHVDGVHYMDVDVSKEKIESFIEGADVVFHLSALARIQPSFKISKEYFYNNVLSTINLAEICKKYKIPIIFAGSSSHHSGKYKNPYTFSKEIGEEILVLYSKIFDLNQSTARFYNVYGPNQLEDGGYETVIGKWDKARRDNTDIVIYGDGSKERDFTHVFDIVDGLIKIWKKKAYGYTFELGRGQKFSLKEVAQMYNRPDKVKHEEDKPGEAQMTLCDYTLAKEILGWKPKLNLEDWINK